MRDTIMLKAFLIMHEASVYVMSFPSHGYQKDVLPVVVDFYENVRASMLQVLA